MLNVSNMTHTALLGQIINTCHISIQLVKRFCKFVNLMLTSCNAIVRHFVRRAINSAQSPIGRNIAIIRHRYTICVVDINVKHVHRQYPSSQPELSGTARCILELLCVSNNETYLPEFTKSEVDTMINALFTCYSVRPFFSYICIAISVSNCTFIVVRINDTHTHNT